MGDITKDDLYELKDDILERVSAGFKPLHDGQREMNQHLRALNGRVGSVERTTDTLQFRVKSLERDDEGKPSGMSGKRSALWLSLAGGGGAAAAEFLRRMLT